MPIIFLMKCAQYFVAKALSVGPGKSYSVCFGQADFDNGCTSGSTGSINVMFIEFEVLRHRGVV